MGVAFVPTGPLLYLSLLGAEALTLGAGLTAAGVLCLAGARTGVALGLAVLASALALVPLVAAISLMLPPPLWLVLTGVGAALLLVGLVWVLLRRWPLVKGPAHPGRRERCVHPHSRPARDPRLADRQRPVPLRLS
jgi:hypothetical protein